VSPSHTDAPGVQRSAESSRHSRAESDALHAVSLAQMSSTSQTPDGRQIDSVVFSQTTSPTALV
jgi:hypothetical protein